MRASHPAFPASLERAGEAVAVVELDEFEAVEAYNGHHPKGFGVGYLLRFDGILVYVSGDTSRTDEMAQMAKLGIDYAFLPIDGIYNMGPAEMMRCAELIDAKRARAQGPLPRVELIAVCPDRPACGRPTALPKQR